MFLIRILAAEKFVHTFGIKFYQRFRSDFFLNPTLELYHRATVFGLFCRVYHWTDLLSTILIVKDLTVVLLNQIIEPSSRLFSSKGNRQVKSQ